MLIPRFTHTLFAASLVFILIVSACSAGKSDQKILPEGTFPVDTLFRRYYAKLGGESILGSAISPVFENGGMIYQYTTNALMVFDPNRKADKVYLAPLGVDMKIFEFPDPSLQSEKGLVVDGYEIHPSLVEIYQRLGGRDVVGRALTEFHWNSESERFEQYFENLGFYWLDAEDQVDVYLLAYGAWKCDVYCRAAPQPNSLINWPSQSAKPFIEAVARLGLRFTGYALTSPYLSTDGRLEQIYENVVMVADLRQPDAVGLLSLPDKVGIPRDVLMPAKLLPNYKFFAIQNNLGYNIPDYFMDYLQPRGGLEFVGSPITQDLQLEDTKIRQCFEKICLEGLRDVNGNVTVQPVSLGVRYRTMYYQTPGAAMPGAELYSDMTIQVWEAYPLVAPDQEQEITVTVYSNNSPVLGVQPELELFPPTGGQQAYVLPATDEKGEARWRIDALEFSNGTLIPYKVCVKSPGGQRFCIRDSYLIWKTEEISIAPQLPVGSTSYFPFVIKNFTIYVPAVVEQYLTYFPQVFHTK